MKKRVPIGSTGEVKISKKMAKGIIKFIPEKIEENG